MKTIHPGRNHENALIWFIKILAGGLIFVFLVIHFIANHLIAPGGLFTFNDVVAYYQNPFVLVMEGCFLAFILVHGLLGLRSVILDLNPPTKFVQFLDIGLTAVGFLALVYGIWLLIAVNNMGPLP
jgi:succinate dehydrogenase hydrophobic anchor subunit